MSRIVIGYDPDDWKELVVKGKQISCDTCFPFNVQATEFVKRNGYIPEGWLIKRESWPGDPGQYALTVMCPSCNADEQARYQIVLMNVRSEKFEAMKQAAIDWQYLVAQGGGIARKSDCEAWLMTRYRIDDYEARRITNQITDGPIYFFCSSDGIEWQERTAKRPAPTREQYPEIDYG